MMIIIVDQIFLYRKIHVLWFFFFRDFIFKFCNEHPGKNSWSRHWSRLNCIIFILWFIALGWYFRGLCSIFFIQILFLCCNLECEFRILQLRFFYSDTNYFFIARQCLCLTCRRNRETGFDEFGELTSSNGWSNNSASSFC